MLNADKNQRREKLVVVGLAMLIKGATINPPNQWVRPWMPGAKQDPRQEFAEAIEGVKFDARPYERDTNKGGSPEWEADLRWLRRWMEQVWSAAQGTADGLYQALGTMAGIASKLTDRDVLLPDSDHSRNLMRRLAEVRDLFSSNGHSQAFEDRIMAISRDAGLFLNAN